jgi:hypothetical protein
MTAATYRMTPSTQWVDRVAPLEILVELVG